MPPYDVFDNSSSQDTNLTPEALAVIRRAFAPPQQESAQPVYDPLAASAGVSPPGTPRIDQIDWGQPSWMDKARAQLERDRAYEKGNLSLGELLKNTDEDTFDLYSGFSDAGIVGRVKGVGKAATEMVGLPAIETKSGKVFTGARHDEAAQQAWDAGHEVADEGFVTNHGRFLNRRSAFDLAQKNGQLTVEPEEGANLHHGNYEPATASGVEAGITKGMETPRPELPRVAANAEQPAADAFHLGGDAYRAGHPLEANPHAGEDLGKEWDRGYKQERKHDRFDRTIAARREGAGATQSQPETTGTGQANSGSAPGVGGQGAAEAAPGAGGVGGTRKATH